MISALNAYWRPIKENEYWDDLDIIDAQNAVKVATHNGMPEKIIDWVWEKEREPFSIY